MSRAHTLSSRFASPRSHGDPSRRVATWARGVRTRLRELGLRLTAYGFEVGGNSLALPGRDQGVLDGAFGTLGPQRIVFLRPGVEGACLALTSRAEHVEVALELSAEGLQAARARLADPGRALELAAALEALPEQFAICVTGDRWASPRPPGVDHGPAEPWTGRRSGEADGTSAEGGVVKRGDVPSTLANRAPHSERSGTAASRASTDEVRTLIDRAQRHQQTLWLGWSISRLVAVENASLLDGQLEDALVALGVVFTMLADVGEPVSPTRPDRTDRRDWRGVDDDATGGKRRARARDRERERDRDRDPSSNAAGKRPRDGAEGLVPARSRKVRSGTTEVSAEPLRSMSRGRRARPSDARAPIEKGVRVRVLEGPFAGKAGIVHEVDCKGGARVMLGLLAVRLAVENLTTVLEGRGRPRISSSHRRPPPVRS